MMEVYRLEDKNGNGLFFYKDGRHKDSSISSWKSNDKGLYSFVDPTRFTEPSYNEFLNNDDYILYKIILSNYLYKNRYGQVIFLEEHIDDVLVCGKDICSQ